MFRKSRLVLTIRSLNPLSVAVCVALGAACFALHGEAQEQEPCHTCGDSRGRPFPAAKFLESNGFATGDYRLLLTWTEAAPREQERTITGYRLSPNDGSKPFEVYCDEDGVLLDDTALDAFGIRQKDWDGAPIGVRPTQSRGAPIPSRRRPTPVGAAREIAPTATVELARVDVAALLAEDEKAATRPPKSAERIGVFQDVPGPVRVTEDKATAGTWRELGGGAKLWSIVIHSPGAKGLRVHFREFRLPAGAHVVVYNADNTSEAYGPFDSETTDGNGFWSPTCFSERVTVECFVSSASADKRLALTIDRAIHVYKGLGTFILEGAKSAGACNLDVTCYPEWASTASAVGGIGTIGGAGYLWCTGSLIADTDPTTDMPYFLTANHCVYDQGEASSIEVYWLYQTDVCDGSAPDPATVPRTTGGADFLAGSSVSSGTDFTLLELRNSPPDGLGYAGWYSGGPSVGAEVTCVHHPRGDFKRITFGSLTTGTDPCWGSPPVPERFHQVTWSEGTTEPGSSGSPLMLNSTGQIIGQLYGGYASCSSPDCPDYYGRFDVTFPLVQRYLAPPVVDVPEASSLAVPLFR